MIAAGWLKKLMLIFFYKLKIYSALSLYAGYTNDVLVIKVLIIASTF